MDWSEPALTATPSQKKTTRSNCYNRGSLSAAATLSSMPERLLLRLHDDGSLTWLGQDARGRILSGANLGAPPAETLARARQIVVLVPSAHVLLTHTALATRQRAQLAKAVPFALEDQLACAVEELHFALPERAAGSSVGVAVVARKTLRGWLDLLAQHAVHADAMLPEALALPVDAAAVTVLVEQSAAVLRHAEFQALTVEPEGLAQWLRLAAAAGIVLPPLEIYDFRNSARLELPLPVANYRDRQRDALAFFAAHLEHPVPINLLQGEFAPAHRQAPVQRLWRIAATLAAACVLLAFLCAGVERWQLARASERLEAEMREVLHASFPELDHASGDPAALMDSALKRLRGETDAGGLLRLLSQIAPVLGSTSRVYPRSMEYRNAILELNLHAPDVATLDSMRERLAKVAGLKVDVTAANPSEGGVDGRLRISGSKS